MKTIIGFLAVTFAGLLLGAPSAFAASASAGASAACKDGTTWSGTSHRGACRGHQGVQSWNDSGSAASSTTTTTTTTAPSSSRKSRAKTSTMKPAPMPTAQTPAVTTTYGSASATCKDGTTWSGASHRGACRGHQGVQSWSSASTTTSASAAPKAPPPMPANSPMNAPVNNSPMGNSRSASTTRTSGPTISTTPAAGGGPGRVWVNTSSKVYHCQNDRWYGKTKNGQYMTEAQATAQGYRGDHGKGCS